MSNSKELDLLIATAFKGEGADAAVAKLKAIATAADQAQTELVRAFNAGELGADEFNAGIAKSQQGVNAYVQASRTAAQTTEAHAAGHGTLASAMGASRQQAAGMVGTLSQMAGASSGVSTAIQSIASGLGPVGITLALFTLQMEEYNKKVAESGKILADYARARAATPIGPIVSLEDTQKMAAANVELEKLTKQMAALKDIQATGGFGGAETERLKQQIADLQAQIDKAAKSTLAASTADQGMRESFRDTTLDANREAVALAAIDGAARRLSAATDIAKTAQAIFDDELKNGDGMRSDYLQWLNDAAAASARLLPPSIFGDEQRTEAAQGKAVELNRQVQESWQKVQDARTKAASAGTSAANQAVSDAAREAATLAKFNADGAAAVSVYGAEAQAAFDLIANSALTAAQKVELLNMWERTLPSEIQQKITVFLAAGGDPALIALLLGGGAAGGSIAGGNQQGNQALFTFMGESIATQTRFLQAYGNDRSAAERAWTQQHLAAVQQSVNTGFDMSGRQLTAAERRLAQDIINAANDKTNSSGDPYAANSDDPNYRPPRYTEYDDRGNRRNPITGAPLPPRDASNSYGGAAGNSAAGGPAGGVVINANIYNKLDIEELAYKVSYIQRRNGR